MTERQDIRMKSDEDKKKVYEDIQALYLQGNKISMEEHKSGFPAVTIDCKDIHILTDIISVEQWWGKKKH